jgi:hypothetical protein
MMFLTKIALHIVGRKFAEIAKILGKIEGPQNWGVI